MLKIGVAILMAFVVVSIASGYLFAGSPTVLQMIMQFAVCVFALAFVLYIIRGLIFGFSGNDATMAFQRVLGIDALLLITVFIISQFNACAISLFGSL